MWQKLATWTKFTLPFDDDPSRTHQKLKSPSVVAFVRAPAREPCTIKLLSSCSNGARRRFAMKTSLGAPSRSKPSCRLFAPGLCASSVRPLHGPIDAHGPSPHEEAPCHVHVHVVSDTSRVWSWHVLLEGHADLAVVPAPPLFLPVRRSFWLRQTMGSGRSSRIPLI